jgi:cytochrome c2
MVALAIAIIGPTDSAGAQTASEDPAARGPMLFQLCFACHSLDPAEQNLPGPSLSGIVGRAAGRQARFKYSPALRRAADGGLVWTPQNLDQWLADPQAFLPGTTMDFIGVRDAADRRDLIGYLQSNPK